MLKNFILNCVKLFIYIIHSLTLIFLQFMTKRFFFAEEHIFLKLIFIADKKCKM